MRQSTVLCVGLAGASNARRAGRLLSMVSKPRLAAHNLDIRLPNSGTSFVWHTVLRPMLTVNSRKKAETHCAGFPKRKARSLPKKKLPRASLKQCKIQHYALPWTTHLKTLLFIPIMWTHLLENLAARLRALHILFQKHHYASSDGGSAGSYGPGQ